MSSTTLTPITAPSCCRLAERSAAISGSVRHRSVVTVSQPRTKRLPPPVADGSTNNRRPPAGAAVLREEVTTAIRAAFFEEVAEVGYGRASIQGVARRAGVGKTAVYRRWASKSALVLDLVSMVGDGGL